MTKERRQARDGAGPPRGQGGGMPGEARSSRPVEPRRPAAQARQAAKRGKQKSSALYMIVPAVIIALLGVTGIWYLIGAKGDGGAAGSTGSLPSSAEAALLADVNWPPYVARAPRVVKEAYEYAVLRPDVLEYMPCYCGCGDHNGHRSNKECFVANMNQGGKSVVFDQHGST